MCPVPGVQIPGWQTLSCLFPFWGRLGVPGGQGDGGASTVTRGHLALGPAHVLGRSCGCRVLARHLVSAPGWSGGAGSGAAGVMEPVALREWSRWGRGNGESRNRVGTRRTGRREDALVNVAPLEARRASPRSGGGVGSSKILAACSRVNIAQLAGGKAQRDSVGARGAEPGSDASGNSSFGPQPR